MSEEQKKKWSDRNFVLAAVSQNGRALQYAYEDLKKDKDIVLAAVSQNGRALQYASDELKKDKEVVLAAVSQNGRALRYASPEMKDDRGVILEAVRLKGDALMYASETLQNDKEIVLAAVRQNGPALMYAFDDLKNNKEVVLTAMMQDPNAIIYSYVMNSTVKPFIPLLDSIKKLRELVKDAKIYSGVSESKPTLDSTGERKEGEKANLQNDALDIVSVFNTNNVEKKYLEIMNNLKKISSESKNNEETTDNKIILRLIGIKEDTIYKWIANITKYKKSGDSEENKKRVSHFKLRL